ncbi:DUF6427 family protein [Gynurincola endophyticus]|jgi:hypothetical protein|uniref:DUF6427 family protein n=1 Tax=Gynurincola endophyticus TaxID=2479004 RepID=UPI000F8D10BC|nr:DUF6427 family protein [Gynurincola endophyticus]
MLKIFKQKNAAHPIFLLLYGLILKSGFFREPISITVSPEDHLLFKEVAAFLNPSKSGSYIFNLLTFILIYIQALLFNKVINQFKLLGKPSYLPAMSYVLITSLVPSWNEFSAPLLINGLLIWLFYGLAKSFTSNQPRADVYNFGIIAAVITLLYQPAVLFIAFVLIGIFVMRPFRFKEWLICLLGVLTPYYFVAVILFLTDKFSWSVILPDLDFHLPVLLKDQKLVISLSLLIFPFLMGAFWVQASLNKMLIQVRKSWSLLLLMILISITIALLNFENNLSDWVLTAVPFAAFHAAAYHYPKKMWFVYLLHWGTFGWCVYQMWNF